MCQICPNIYFFHNEPCINSTTNSHNDSKEIHQDEFDKFEEGNCDKLTFRNVRSRGVRASSVSIDGDASVLTNQSSG